MRVATFNTCHGTRGRGTAVDLDALVAAIAALDADVVGLQEVDQGVRRSARIDQAAHLAEACGMHHAFAAAQDLDGGRYGNALLVKGRVLDAEPMLLRGRWRPRGADRRGALLARVESAGTTVSVAVAHLSLGLLDNVAQERAVLDRLAAMPEPRVLLGDLNRRSAWVAPAARRVGLTLVEQGGPTAPADVPRFRIDHVAVQGLGVGRVTVVDTGTSDHRALVVDLDTGRSRPGAHGAIAGEGK